MAKLTSMVELS